MEIIEKLLDLQDAGLAVSTITISEIYEGIYYTQSNFDESEKALNDFLSGVSVLEVNRGIARIFGQHRARLRKEGDIIDNFDILIASAALYYNLTVLTNNKKHFVKIKGLNIFSV